MVLVHGHARRSAMAEYRESDLLTCGYYKIASTLPNVLRRLKPAPRAYWGFFGPLVSTSAASQAQSPRWQNNRPGTAILAPRSHSDYEGSH